MRVLIILALFSTFNLQAQLKVTLGGMDWTCTKDGNYLLMELRAPTTGWVAVGFNSTNNIVQSDLLMMHIVNGKVECQDMYVKGLGDPRLDDTLGGSQDLEIIAAEEKNNETYLQFRRSWPAKDKYDYQLQNGQAFWLILAYSTHDEFDHHSRMRKHKEVVFK